MKKTTTLLIIVALVVAVPVGPASAHPPICGWVASALGADAVASEVGARLPAFSSVGIVGPMVGHWTLSLVRVVVHQVGSPEDSNTSRHSQPAEVTAKRILGVGNDG